VLSTHGDATLEEIAGRLRTEADALAVLVDELEEAGLIASRLPAPLH
jgi:DNA-binding MarR family transcriptional regulator